MSNIQESTNDVMNNDLAEKLEQKRDVIKNTVAKGATDDELDMFMHLAKQYGLDPFQKEIFFWKFGSKDPTVMTSRDGYLKIANQHKQFNGHVADVVHENDTFKKLMDGVEHTYSLGNRGKIVGAYCLVYREDRKFPVYVFAPYEEYKRNTKVWKQYPSAMILKVAESMSLKRAFSVSGLVSKEGMGYEKEQQQSSREQKSKAEKFIDRDIAETESKHHDSMKVSAEMPQDREDDKKKKQEIVNKFAEVINDDTEILNADVVKDTAEQKFDTRDIGKLSLEQLQELKETLFTDDPEVEEGKDDVIDVTPDGELTEEDKQGIEESLNEGGTGK